MTDTQLLTLNTIDSDRDDLSPNTVLCPALGRAYDELDKSPAVQSYYNTKLGALAKKFSSLWNITVDLSEMDHINDVVRTRYCHNQPMPPYMSLSEAEQIMEAILHLNVLKQSNFTVTKFSVYTIFKEFLASLQDPSVKFSLYSAHDSSLLAFLVALENGSQAWPPLASHILWQLWTDTNGNQFVSMQYDGVVANMKAPCKSEYCSLQDFQALIETFKYEPSECN